MKFAIVGAGISGLAAAGLLQQRGHEGALFDKARGAGGRMATRRDKGYMFDHGAQYFTARDPEFRQYVDRWTQAGLIEKWTGRLGVREHGEISPIEQEIDRFVGVPRMSALTRHLSGGLNGLYGDHVDAAHWSSGSWTLEVGGREAGPFDGLIVTTPPDQAVPLLTDVPELATLAARVTMKPCWAMMMVFGTRLPTGYDGLFINEGPLSWAARNNSKPGRPAAESWVAHASAAWSAANLELDRTEIPGHLLSAFFHALDLDPMDAEYVQAHRWRYALASDPLEEECLSDNERRVVVAGDWVNGSKVEGAFLSGMAAAQRALTWHPD